MVELSELEESAASKIRKSVVERILVSEQFVRAPRLQRFLSYITDCYFQNRLDEITEQQIGVHVFDKSATYNPGDDNSVRSYARTLRKRLEEYFVSEGHLEPVILQVPRGKYVPLFTVREKNSLSHTDVQEGERKIPEEIGLGIAKPDVPVRKGEQLRSGLMSSIKWLAILVFCMCIAAIIAFRMGRKVGAANNLPAEHAFWSAFTGSRKTLIVPSDTGLTVVLGLTKRQISIPDYVTGKYILPADDQQSLPEGWANTNVHRYTDLMDLRLVNALTHRPELEDDRTGIRYARDLRSDDLKEGNAILIGGVNADPWVQLFDQKLNFALEFVPEERNFIIKNRSPRSGEPSSFVYGPANWSQVSYGLIALRPNLAGTGSVLIIEGVAAAGLQGAAEYLMSEKNMASLLPQITEPHGNLRPFEILFRTNNVGASATKTEVVGIRVE